VPIPVHAQWCAWCSEQEAIAENKREIELDREMMHLEEPYCPFCQKRHPGGDTCMGHHP
jgi:hypothetical protein